MAARHPIRTMVVVALIAWVILVLYGKLVSPEGAVAPIMFLVLLLVALTATFTSVAQFVGSQFVRSKWYAQHAWRHALRQGALVAITIVANLALKALDAWFWADVLLIALAAVLVELIALARK